VEAPPRTLCETTVHQLSLDLADESNAILLGASDLNGKVRLIDAQETFHGPRA
jgi:hypothetical protein